MTKYSTGNPVGSADARDLFDNATVTDNLINGQNNAYPDRLGKSRKSWAGIEKDFDDFLKNSGYELLGDYASGIEVTAYNQVIRDAGQFWAPAAGTSLPYTTTGAGMDEGGAFVSRGDAVLRQDLADTSPGQGASLVLLEDGSSVESGVKSRVHRVSSRASMKAVNAPVDYQFSLDEGGRSGAFVVKSGTPPSDPEEGIYVVLNNGNYAERIEKTPNPKLFGGHTDGTLSDSALQACVDMFPGERIYLDDGEHNYSVVPTGIDNVRFEGSSRIMWTNVRLPVFNGIMTDGLETALVSGVIRYYPSGANGAGWYLLVNQGADHDPILLEEVTASGNFSVILSVKFSDLGLDPALWTPSGVVVGPDETLAEEGVNVGASVNTTDIEIKGSISQNIPEYVEYDGSAWQGPSVYNFNWNTDHLVISRDSAERREGVSSTKNCVMIQMAYRSVGTQIAAARVFEASADAVHVYFYDYSGSVITAPTPNMRFFLMDPYLPASQYFFSQASGAPGNIWLLGAFVRKPGSIT